jgi:hypothetical protein
LKIIIGKEDLDIIVNDILQFFEIEDYTIEIEILNPLPLDGVLEVKVNYMKDGRKVSSMNRYCRKGD